MRPLIIDDEARARAAAIVAHAEAHPYRPPEDRPPGDIPEHVGMFGTYCTVFSFTQAGGILCRHLSVSVPGGLYPNPYAVFTLAALFGFTGWTGGEVPSPTWAFTASESPVRYIVVVEPVRMTVPKEERQ